MYALPTTQIIGGDLYLKRALYDLIRHPGRTNSVAANDNALSTIMKAA